MHRALAALSFVTTLSLTHVAWSDPWPSIPIPAENAAALRTAPARPPIGDLATRAADLVRALNTASDADIQTAASMFLQRDPFLAIKDMSGAAGYFNTLLRWYARDIREVKATLGGATWTLDHVEAARSCTWMTIGREANRLPYYACYGSRLVLRTGNRTHTVRIAVLINFGQQWFITHLQPIHRNSSSSSSSSSSAH